MNNVMKDKLKAASIHLAISFCLVILCALIVFFIWYPNPLVAATGVGTLFLMMLGIDLILGPAFTFIVFKKFKKTLKFDIFIIVIIQLSAMVYGMYAMFEGRPVWIAFTVDRFELVRANEIVDENSKYQVSYFGPKYIAVALQPRTAAEKLKMMLTEVQTNISPAQQTQYYRPFEQAQSAIREKSESLSELKEYNSLEQVNAIERKYPEATAWLPLKANGTDMVVLVNQNSGQVIKIVDLRPWR